MALLEAMANGLPSSSHRWAASRTFSAMADGMLVTPGNVEQIRAAMARLIDDTARQRPGAARDARAPFDVHVYARRSRTSTSESRRSRKSGNTHERDRIRRRSSSGTWSARLSSDAIRSTTSALARTRGIEGSTAKAAALVARAAGAHARARRNTRTADRARRREPAGHCSTRSCCATGCGLHHRQRMVLGAGQHRRHGRCTAQAGALARWHRLRAGLHRPPGDGGPACAHGAHRGAARRQPAGPGLSPIPTWIQRTAGARASSVRTRCRPEHRTHRRSLENFAPQLLCAYPSALEALCRCLHENGRTLKVPAVPDLLGGAQARSLGARAGGARRPHRRITTGSPSAWPSPMPSRRASTASWPATRTWSSFPTTSTTAGRRTSSTRSSERRSGTA